MMAMTHKTIRIPDNIIEFVNAQPGKDFSKKIVGILSAYKNLVEDTTRRNQIKDYNETVNEIERLIIKLRKANSKLADINCTLEEAPVYQLSFNSDLGSIVVENEK